MTIPAFEFDPPAVSPVGFEATDLAELRRRVGYERLAKVHRTDFHTITLVMDGTGSHVVDFRNYRCGPGTLLWVRPGQVQRFDPASTMQGPHLLFTADFAPDISEVGRVINGWTTPTCQQLGDDTQGGGVVPLLDQLRVESAQPPTPMSRQILKLLLGALMLHVERSASATGAGVPPYPGGDIYAKLRYEVEQYYTATRRTEDYARRLGYSVKTLTRACVAATGRGAKDVIDERVALEARRLLAHTDDPVAVIAGHLGFSEVTNFVKFFARRTGVTPRVFRRAQRTLASRDEGELV